MRDVAYRYPNEYFFGPSLVISPIVDPRDVRTNLARSRTWVPPGRYVDIFTGVVYDGDRELDMYRSLQSMPALAPEGSIIALDKDVAPTNGCKNPDAFEVIVVVGRDGDFDIIEDDGDDRNHVDGAPVGERIFHISYDQIAGQVHFESGSRAWKVRFLALELDSSTITVRADNSELSAPCLLDETGTVVDIAPLGRNSRIIIDVGPNPQLRMKDRHKFFKQLILDLQISFYLKDRIWEILQADQPSGIKAGRILALDMEDAFKGPFLELLLADSRV
jgi:hypothetical protein